METMGIRKKNTKVDLFLDTGISSCKKHGSHSEFGLQLHKRVQDKSTTRQIYCRICAKDRRITDKNKRPGYGIEYSKKYRATEAGLMSGVFARAKGRAKKGNIPFSITKEWVYNTLKNQDYKCAYSGIKFTMSLNNRDIKFGKKNPYMPSLDQIVPGLGYTDNNTAIVAAAVNLMKLDIPLDSFIGICSAISEHNKIGSDYI